MMIIMRQNSDTEWTEWIELNETVLNMMMMRQNSMIQNEQNESNWMKQY
jgi:hypothetical protein